MLSKKSQMITPSLTMGISTKVKELKSSGIEVVNLSIGEPDFFTPELAKKAAMKAIERNLTKYDAAAGVKELRQAITKKLKEDNHIDYDETQIVVSSGAKHAITNALMAILDPGDEVIIPVPYWVSYPEMVKLTGGSPVFADTKKENSFKLTPEEFQAAITDKTKAIFITNPSNPTGAVYHKDELEKIVEIALEKDIYIIADEIYEQIVYDVDFTAIASLSPEAYAKTITINGLSKAASMTGWRIGYTATPKDMAKAIGSIQGHLVSHPSTISQYAALEALTTCKPDADHMRQTYDERRKVIVDRFEQLEGYKLIYPEGAFYTFIDISALRAFFPEEESLSLKVCDDLLEKHQVAFVPGIAFGKDDFIRMSYAASLPDIHTGIDRLEAYYKSL